MKQPGVPFVLGVLIVSFAIAAFYGTAGLLGMAAAWFAGGLGVAALVGMSAMVGRLMADKASPRTGTFIIVLGSFVKFPLLIAAWWVVRQYGSVAEQSFIGGIVAVYFALVGWAATRNAAQP